ncbi:hypothetical protein [Paracoccus albus]|uniref:hypothetical protein n=1 Tax=Paracoccus albus TaxID=3017784 RepID=UPI0022F058E5|nr:hypothetical protein [Paracoccus albus]WBU59999.1 hypothetical protein PAF20_14805 [Paracoccus albus]
MNFSSIGDLSQFIVMRSSNLALRTDIQRLSSETTTGVREDIPKHLRGDLLDLSRLSHAIQSAEAYQRNVKEAETAAKAMQLAFSNIQKIADSQGIAMQSDVSLASDKLRRSVASIAESQLDDVIASLNTRLGGRYLLSGTKANIAPIKPAEKIIEAAAASASGAKTAEQTLMQLREWFADDTVSGNVGENFYQGSVRDYSMHGVGPSQTISFTQTANEEGVREVLLGLTIGALVSRGAFYKRPDQQAELMRAGGSSLLEGSAALSLSMASLGSVEHAIEQASIRLEREINTLQIERTELISVDSYEVGSQLVQAEAQLRALYAVTARLSNLSLATYL